MILQTLTRLVECYVTVRPVHCTLFPDTPSYQQWSVSLSVQLLQFLGKMSAASNERKMKIMAEKPIDINLLLDIDIHVVYSHLS